MKNRLFTILSLILLSCFLSPKDLKPGTQTNHTLTQHWYLMDQPLI